MDDFPEAMAPRPLHSLREIDRDFLFAIIESFREQAENDGMRMGEYEWRRAILDLITEGHAVLELRDGHFNLLLTRSGHDLAGTVLN